MKVISVLLTAILVLTIAPTIAFAHYPHTKEECPSTEQIGQNPKCLIEQRESGKEVKFVDLYFSEGANNMGGNQNTNIPTKIEIEPGDGTTKLVAVMANSGSFVLTGMKGWLSLPLGFQAVGRATGDPAFDTYDLAVPVGGVFIFEFPVIVGENTRVGMYPATLHVEYFKERDIGLNYRDFTVEFFLPGRSVINAVIDDPIIPTITRVPLTVSVYNNGTAMMSAVEITVSTPITATVALDQQVPEASKSPIMILEGDGYTKVNTIRPGEKADVKVTLFASEEAVNTAFQLPVTIRYVDPNGVAKQIQRFVSVYVQGTISLRVYDLGITYIANEPNISGYLLNEGTNLALFTIVEIVNDQEVIKQVSGPQYLGDLTANSPLPFNIPVRFADGTKPGTYPVTVKVSYKDDLRIPFEVMMHGTVTYSPNVVEKKESSNIFSNMSMFIGIGAAVVVGSYVAYRRMRTSKKGELNENEDELDFLNEKR
ncbi:MAG: hypothetical protein QXU32_10270 [Nitrososphaerales archaeon]